MSCLRHTGNMMGTLRTFALWENIFITVFSLLFLTQGGAWAAEWIEEPSDTESQVGENVTFKCRISNRGNLAVSWSRYENGQFTILFIDTSPWTDDSHLSITEYADGFDLEITGVQRTDNGEYECSLQQAALKTKVMLTVEVPPTLPSITKNQTSPLIEGDHLMIICSSAEGNPAPSITWLKNGNTLTGATLTPPQEAFGVTLSNLLVTLDSSDHLANYTCLVENVANAGSPLVSSLILQVQYAPIITFGDYNPLVVIEETRVTLNCQVNAYPPVSDQNIRWFKDSNYIGTGQTHEFLAISAADSGFYDCSAQNAIGERRETLTIDVQYGPKLTFGAGSIPVINSVVEINEEVPLNLTCTVDANPAILGSIEWSSNGQRLTTTTSYLYIGSVSRQNAGTYTCRASNTLHPSGENSVSLEGYANIEVVVRYKPGTASITGPAYAIAGNSVTLGCTLSDAGVPPAMLLWTEVGSNTPLHTGNQYVINPVALSNDGQYECQPTNDVGDGIPDTYTLIVNELPSWVEDLPTEKVVKVDGAVQDPLSVQCGVRGRPKPTIRWYKDNVLITGQNGDFNITTVNVPVDSVSFRVTSTLYWSGVGRTPSQNSLRIEDAGLYSCRVSSDITNEDSVSEMTLYVEYIPVIDASVSKVATEISGGAILICQAHGHPAPSFMWMNDTTTLTPGGRIQIEDSVIDGMFPYQSILTISSVSEYDLVSFMCTASNEIGSSSLPILVTLNTVPDAPSDVYIVSQTWESVFISWLPGFDGGFTQTFFVKYSSVKNSHEGVTVPAGVTSYNITMLFPNVTYTIEVFSENQLGQSDLSPSVTMTTNATDIAAASEVYYRHETRTLTFQSPSTHYCVRVEIENGMLWSTYENCAPSTGGSIKIHEDIIVYHLRVALCLELRQEICGPVVNAVIVDPPQNDLSIETIIIVAAICGSIVLILLIILIVLCWRRYQSKKKDEEYHRTHRHDVQIASGSTANNTADKNVKGFDNPGMERDTMEFDNRRPAVFTTNTSNIQPPPTGNYVTFDHRSNTANGHIQPPNGYNIPPPEYNETMLNDRHNSLEKPKLPEHESNSIMSNHRNNDSYRGHDSHRGGHDSHLGNDSRDSGVSTPDPTKPRKVIYEVIV